MVSGNEPAEIPARNTAGACLSSDHSSPRDYAGLYPSVITGSNPDVRTASQLVLQPSKKKRKEKEKEKKGVHELSLPRRSLLNLELKVTSQLVSSGHFDSVRCRL
jgi:hypothetical protein